MNKKAASVDPFSIIFITYQIVMKHEWFKDNSELCSST